MPHQLMCSHLFKALKIPFVTPSHFCVNKYTEYIHLRYKLQIASVYLYFVYSRMCFCVMYTISAIYLTFMRSLSIYIYLMWLHSKLQKSPHSHNKAEKPGSRSQSQSQWSRKWERECLIILFVSHTSWWINLTFDVHQRNSILPSACKWMDLYI